MADKDKKTLFKIGDLAGRAGVTARTVRYYEELGLLSPAETSPGGFRLYTENDLIRLMFIKRFQELDFSLEEIRRILTEAGHVQSKEEQIRSMEILLEEEERHIGKRIAELEKARQNIASARKCLEACRACDVLQCMPECKNKEPFVCGRV